MIQTRTRFGPATAFLLVGIAIGGCSESPTQVAGGLSTESPAVSEAADMSMLAPEAREALGSAVADGLDRVVPALGDVEAAREVRSSLERLAVAVADGHMSKIAAARSGVAVQLDAYAGSAADATEISALRLVIDALDK
jgi:hypothetical protein